MQTNLWIVKLFVISFSARFTLFFINALLF